MNFRSAAMFLFVVAATAVSVVFHEAIPVQAQTVPGPTLALPQRFLAELVGPSAGSFAFLQAPAAKNKAAEQAAPLPEGKGKDLTQKNCGTCHATSVWTKQHHTRDQWSSVLDNMVSKGLNIPDSDLEIINDYLATYFAPAKSTPASPDASTPQPASPDAAPAPK